jgi:hypothetical protein
MHVSALVLACVMLHALVPACPPSMALFPAVLLLLLQQQKPWNGPDSLSPDHVFSKLAQVQS